MCASVYLILFFCYDCRTDFIITASHDGHVKFWKKIEEGIEFVKHFRSHLGEKLLFLLSKTSLFPPPCSLLFEESANREILEFL